MKHHGDVMTWKWFSNGQPFVKGTTGDSVKNVHSNDVCYVFGLNKLSNCLFGRRYVFHCMSLWGYLRILIVKKIIDYFTYIQSSIVDFVDCINGTHNNTFRFNLNERKKNETNYRVHSEIGHILLLPNNLRVFQFMWFSLIHILHQWVFHGQFLDHSICIEFCLLWPCATCNPLFLTTQ